MTYEILSGPMAFKLLMVKTVFFNIHSGENISMGEFS